MSGDRSSKTARILQLLTKHQGKDTEWESRVEAPSQPGRRQKKGRTFREEWGRNGRSENEHLESERTTVGQGKKVRVQFLNRNSGGEKKARTGIDNGPHANEKTGRSKEKAAKATSATPKLGERKSQDLEYGRGETKKEKEGK